MEILSKDSYPSGIEVRYKINSKEYLFCTFTFNHTTVAIYDQGTIVRKYNINDLYDLTKSEEQLFQQSLVDEWILYAKQFLEDLKCIQ